MSKRTHRGSKSLAQQACTELIKSVEIGKKNSENIEGEYITSFGSLNTYKSCAKTLFTKVKKLHPELRDINMDPKITKQCISDALNWFDNNPGLNEKIYTAKYRRNLAFAAAKVMHCHTSEFDYTLPKIDSTNFVNSRKISNKNQKFNLNNKENAAFFDLAIKSKLRKNELRTLKTSQFKLLPNGDVKIYVDGKYDKAKCNRKRFVIIRADNADETKELLLHPFGGPVEPERIKREENAKKQNPKSIHHNNTDTPHYIFTKGICNNVSPQILRSMGIGNEYDVVAQQILDEYGVKSPADLPRTEQYIPQKGPKAGGIFVKRAVAWVDLQAGHGQGRRDLFRDSYCLYCTIVEKNN